ncbi:hypothetical protein V0U79_05860 [Hyphobacterium sp. HN65]|uniref:Uncharacterized protein n=1 Tax=Hyphobacterium lacteum TaxID=3116575 RepID=A0ABU7LRD8_9PROT|nr:hypothetical protein [Hyphobacterium sp. HN65]MEE2525884.1 hypothetical protein [Hyphobacterium sp. HN65]
MTGQGVEATTIMLTGEPSAIRIMATHRLGDPNIVPSAGAFIPLFSHELQALRGRRFSVEFVFSPDGNEADQKAIQTGVFFPGMGQNGWEESSISPENPIIRRLAIPNMCQLDYVYLGVWPTNTGEAGSVDLTEMRIDLLDQIECNEDDQ